MDLQALKTENSRRLREDWREQREIFRARPEVIGLNHSNACRLRCVTCWHHTGVPIQRIDLRHVERICHQLLPTARKLILTASGEPLLNDFDEITALARHYETRLDMTTSALDMTEERFRRTRDLFDVLHVSMDCPDRTDYERVRVGSSYDRVVENLRMMRRVFDAEGRPFNYYCHAALLASTVHHLPAFVRFAHEHGFDVLHVQRLYKTHAGLEEEDLLTRLPRPTVDAIVAEALAEARRLNQSLILEAIGYPNFHADPPPRPEEPVLMRYRDDGACWFVGQAFNINHAGEAFACCIPTNLYLGDALTQPVEKIWNGRAMRRLRRSFFTGRLGPFCRSCLVVHENPEETSGLDLHRRSRRLWWFELGKRTRKAIAADLRAADA